jgi:hypothetical protein
MSHSVIIMSVTPVTHEVAGSIPVVPASFPAKTETHLG